MSLNFAKGKFKLKNPDKYIGLGTPTYRSSWEFAVMQMCDGNPAIQQWASESIKIPYRDPLTGKQTVYVPDFFVVYVDAKHKKHAEIWEIKPAKQAYSESVGKNPYDQASYIRNRAKWQVANQWAKGAGVKFRVITEHDIFHMGGSKK